MSGLSRGERLQIMLSPEELKTIDDWRFQSRMPSRAAAIRELLMRGLQAAGYDTVAGDGAKSADFGVIKRHDGSGQSKGGDGPGYKRRDGSGHNKPANGSGQSPS